LGTQPVEERYSQLLLRLNYIYQQAIQLKNLELARRTAVDLAQLLRQQRKELLHGSSFSSPSKLVEADELEALVQSLAIDGETEPE